MSNNYTKGFTLIELLMVITLIGIIAAGVFVAINPAQAQRKARDSKRFSDITTLQILLEQYINDGGGVSGLTIENPGATSAAVSQKNKQPACPSGTATWLTIDTCKYSPIVPLDPMNGLTKKFILDASLIPPTQTPQTAAYRARIVGANYEVNVMIESVSNAGKIVEDGGDSNQWLEAGSDLSLLN